MELGSDQTHHSSALLFYFLHILGSRMVEYAKHLQLFRARETSVS